MTRQEIPLISQVRYAISKWLNLILCITQTFYFCLNYFVLDQVFISAYQFINALFCAYFFCSALKGKPQEWHYYALSLIITINLISVVSSADLRAGSIYWSFAFPLVYYMLFGAKKGLIFSLMIFFPIASILFYRSDLDHNIPYRSIINFALSYFTVWSICHLYERHRMTVNQALQKMALEDALTGMQNRHALKIFFESIKDIQKNIHTLVVDIDHFKNINDRFGHEAGDALLIEMADLLESRVDPKSIYRLGGEEFLIILEYVPDNEALSFAENLREAVEHHQFRKENDINVTVSIGVSKFQHGQAFSEFLRAADENLYRAKKDGRNLVRSEY